MADYAARRTAMVDTQVRPSDVTKFPIINAMLSVAKEDFVHAGQRETSYVGENIDLGQGRVILEPRTMAKMLDGSVKDGESHCVGRCTFGTAVGGCAIAGRSSGASL